MQSRLPVERRQDWCQTASLLGWQPVQKPFAVRTDTQTVPFVNQRVCGDTRLMDLDATVDGLLTKLVPLVKALESEHETGGDNSHDQDYRWSLAVYFFM